MDNAQTPSSDAGLTPRLVRRVRSDFPGNAAEILDLLRQVESGNQNRERVMASVVLTAASDVSALLGAIELSQLDWRDVLVNGGMADEGWPERLNQILGRSTR